MNYIGTDNVDFSSMIAIILLIIPALVGYFVSIPLVISGLTFQLLLKAFPCSNADIRDTIIHNIRNTSFGRFITLFCCYSPAEAPGGSRIKQCSLNWLNRLIHIAMILSIWWIYNIFMSNPTNSPFFDLFTSIDFIGSILDLSNKQMYVFIALNAIHILLSNPLLIASNIILLSNYLHVYYNNGLINGTTTSRSCNRTMFIISLLIVNQVVLLYSLYEPQAAYYETLPLLFILAANISVVCIVEFYYAIVKSSNYERLLYSERLASLVVVLIQGIAVYYNTDHIIHMKSVDAIVYLFIFIFALSHVTRRMKGHLRNRVCIESAIIYAAIFICEQYWWISIIAAVISLYSIYSLVKRKLINKTNPLMQYE